MLSFCFLGTQNINQPIDPSSSTNEHEGNLLTFLTYHHYDPHCHFGLHFPLLVSSEEEINLSQKFEDLMIVDPEISVVAMQTWPLKKPGSAPKEQQKKQIPLVITYDNIIINPDMCEKENSPKKQSSEESNFSQASKCDQEEEYNQDGKSINQ